MIVHLSCMAEQSGVEFIEEWQSGAFLILLSVVVGAVLVIGLGSLLPSSPVAMLGVFLIGGIAAFVASSYIMYGR